MGWEAGLLSGFLGRKGEVEAENRRAAELSSQRESDVYRALLGEGVNPEIQAMALAGMLESAQPKKKKGGFKGWLGEMETSPTFQRLQQFLTTPQVEERETLASSRISGMGATGMPPLLAGQTVQPTATDIPPDQAQAAMAQTSPVQPGGGPPQPLSYTQSPPTPYSVQGRLPTVFQTPEERAALAAKAKGMSTGAEYEATYRSVYQAERNLGRAHAQAADTATRAALGSSGISGSQAMRFGGTLKGDMVPVGQVDTFGQPVKPEQWYRTQIQPDGRLMYVPTVTPSGPSAGVEYNRAAVMMGFTRPADVPPERRAELEEKAEKFAQELRYATGTGAGQAQIETELNMPIGATAAIQYGVPPTTTLRQLSETIGLSPEQKQRVYTLGQVDVLIADIDRLIPQVFPEVAAGIGGRIKTQLSLGLQKLSADADYAALEASVNGALAQIAQLSGQPGSRLSDRDVEIARSQMVALQPSLFGGDTIRTARAKMDLLKGLLDKARGAIATPVMGAQPKPGASAAPPTPSTLSPTAVQDKNGNWVIRTP